MIPITLERNYKPDGWLGMLAGSKVWLDFTEKSRFEGHVQMLLRQIGERGKSERAVNILYINDHNKLGMTFVILCLLFSVSFPVLG